MPQFNLDAFLEILRRELDLTGQSQAAWAKAHGISPGHLHDLTSINPDTGDTRRDPSRATLKKLAMALNVPLRAIVNDPSRSVAS